MHPRAHGTLRLNCSKSAAVRLSTASSRRCVSVRPIVSLVGWRFLVRLSLPSPSALCFCALSQPAMMRLRAAAAVTRTAAGANNSGGTGAGAAPWRQHSAHNTVLHAAPSSSRNRAFMHSRAFAGNEAAAAAAAVPADNDNPAAAGSSSPLAAAGLASSGSSSRRRYVVSSERQAASREAASLALSAKTARLRELNRLRATQARAASLARKAEAEQAASEAHQARLAQQRRNDFPLLDTPATPIRRADRSFIVGSSAAWKAAPHVTPLLRGYIEDMYGALKADHPDRVFKIFQKAQTEPDLGPLHVEAFNALIVACGKLAQPEASEHITTHTQARWRQQPQRTSQQQTRAWSGCSPARCLLACVSL